MSDVLKRIEQVAGRLAEQSDEADEIGRLGAETARLLREVGVIRLLQPREFGGYESHPNEFFEAVMQVCTHSGSAGWVAGVVGVHPWQLGQIDQTAQTEIWGKDPDTWIASPYAPFGRARAVDGGYVLHGQWPFSTGTDYAEWVILGGMLTDSDGNVGAPPQVRHFLLPKGDYEVVADSWEVMGLKGKWMYDVVAAGGTLPLEQRIEARRNQVAAAGRAVRAVDTLFAHAGGGSIRLANPLQRFWRDLHAAMNHLCNVAEPVHLTFGSSTFGLPLPPGGVY